MKLVDTPTALPGSCKICGTGDPGRGPFLDTLTSEEYHGAVYYCRECCLEIARLFGCLPPNECQILKDTNETLQERVANQVKTIDGLERAIDGLRSAGYSNGLSDLPYPSFAPVQVSDERSEGTESPVGTGTGTPDESSDDEGMEQLHSDEPAVNSEFRLNI